MYVRVPTDPPQGTPVADRPTRLPPGSKTPLQPPKRFNTPRCLVLAGSSPRDCFVLSQLEPGASVLLHYKTHAVVGILGDEVDPMVSVMKVDKAPLESYADIGGLEQQIQEIKVWFAGSNAKNCQLCPSPCREYYCVHSAGTACK